LIVRDTALERFKHDMENFEKAASRITATADIHGGPEPAAMAWLLKFLSTDLTMLNEWQKDEAFWNLYRFCWDGGQEAFTDFGRMGAMSLHFPESAEERTTIVAHIQRDARAALTDYVRTGIGTFPKGEAAFSVMRCEYQPLGYRGGDLASSFYYMAAQLLSRYRHRVKQCEGCPLIMLVGRKDQRFHSQSCQIATFFRKKRAKKKAERLARAQRKQMKAKRKKAAKKTVKGKKPKQRKGGKHGTSKGPSNRAGESNQTTRHYPA
jgi:hypothetical protein